MSNFIVLKNLGVVIWKLPCYIKNAKSKIRSENYEKKIKTKRRMV